MKTTSLTKRVLPVGSAGAYLFDFGGTGGQFTYSLISFGSTTFIQNDVLPRF